MASDLQFLDWDTKFFGKKIAQVKTGSPKFNKAWWEKIFAEAKDAGADCLYVRVPVDANNTIQYCQTLGARVLSNQVTLDKVLTGEKLPLSDDICEGARTEHHPQLLDLCRDLSALSRFSRDPRFGPEAASRMYDVWIQESIQHKFEQKIWTSVSGGAFSGFLVAGLRAKLPHINLVGVVKAEQGRGTGQKLMSQAAHWAQSLGGENLRVVTQDSNPAALVAYQKFGFKPYGSETILHLWFS